MWQGRVIRLLGDLVTGYGVRSVPCRTPAGRGGSTAILVALCVLSASSVRCLHQGCRCQKTERKAIRGSIPLSVGINTVFPERNALSTPPPLPSEIFLFMYLQVVALCLVVVLPVLRRIIKSSSAY